MAKIKVKVPYTVEQFSHRVYEVEADSLGEAIRILEYAESEEEIDDIPHVENTFNGSHEHTWFMAEEVKDDESDG